MRRRAGMIRYCIYSATAMVGFRSVAWSQTTASWLNPSVAGSWTDTSRWSTAPFYPNNDNPPGIEYEVSIETQSGSGLVALSLAENIAINRLYLAAWPVNLTHTSGTLNVRNFMDVQSGRYRIAGGDYRNPGVTTLSGDGTIELLSGSASIGFLNSSATLSAAGGTLNIGTLTQVLGRTEFSGADVILASPATLTAGGSISLTGGTLQSHGFRVLGPAQFLQSSGTHTATGFMHFGGGASYQLTGGRLTLTDAYLAVGVNGAGAFSQFAGTIVQPDEVHPTVVGGQLTSFGAGTFLIDGVQTNYPQAPNVTSVNLVGIGT